MWAIEREQIDFQGLKLEPNRVLYEYDGPRIFTFNWRGGQWLAYQCAQNTDRLRFLVVPLNTILERQLTLGLLDMRNALWRTSVLVCDVDRSWRTVACWSVRPEELPAKVIPRAGVMLWGHLRPFIRTQVAAATSTTATSVSLSLPTNSRYLVCEAK